MDKPNGELLAILERHSNSLSLSPHLDLSESSAILLAMKLDRGVFISSSDGRNIIRQEDWRLWQDGFCNICDDCGTMGHYPNLRVTGCLACELKLGFVKPGTGVYTDVSYIRGRMQIGYVYKDQKHCVSKLLEITDDRKTVDAETRAVLRARVMFPDVVIYSDCIQTCLATKAIWLRGYNPAHAVARSRMTTKEPR